MYTVLGGGKLLAKFDQHEHVDLALKYGFAGIDPLTGFFQDSSDADIAQLKTKADDNGLKWGIAGLPVNVSLGEDHEVREQLDSLGATCAKLKTAGVKTLGTWIAPFSLELTYDRNFAQHVDRFQTVARELDSHGLSLALEYVGPKTLRADKPYEFIASMTESLKLIDAVGASNVGLFLDSFHWFTAGESVEHLQKLEPSRILGVDLNDAPRGKELDQQEDFKRARPGETGVIDLAGFLGAIRAAHYEGPVYSEPFSDALKEQDPEERVRDAAADLKAALAD